MAAAFGLSLLLTAVGSIALREAQQGSAATPEVAAGVLWLVFLFSAVAILNHSLAVEREDNVFWGTLAGGAEPSSVFLSKFLVNFAALTLLGGASALFAMLFLGVPAGANLPGLAIVGLLAIAGVSSLGTLFAAMATATAAREILLPVLLAAMLLPAIAVSVSLARGLYAGGALDYASASFLFLAGIDLLGFCLAFLSFEFLLSE
jgi:ABC-type transport system involved in cytochrome c biogenesis permease component